MILDWLVEPFSQGFMQRALLGGVLAAVATGLVGTWIVLRGISFMGDALAHGVLPGIVIAFVVGLDLTIGALGGAVVMILGINLVHRKAGLREETGIGLMFVGMLALGIVIISRTPSFSDQLSEFLFGNALGVDAADLIVEAVAAFITILGTFWFYRPFLVLSFNEEQAQVLGLRPRIAHFVMLLMLTGAIVASFRAVGTLLVFGLLVAPPATASLLARRVPQMMATAVILGILSVLGGLLISWHAHTAAGATIAGLAVAIFFVALAARGALRERLAGKPQLSSSP